WRWMLSRALNQQTDDESGDADFGTQVESDVSYNPDEPDEEPEQPDDEVEFEEAPRMLVDAERYGDDSSRAAESTWPTNPWRPGSPASRENSPWRSAYRPDKKDSENE